MKESQAKSNSFKAMFIVSTAAILLVALLTASILERTFTYFGLIDLDAAENTGWYWILIFIFTSLIIGLVLAFLLGRLIFKPVNIIIDGMTRLSDGDYSTRIDLGSYDTTKEIAASFNMLAMELENTEILRSDFVNDFSHELKTPIVSLSGLISLLKNEKLPESKRKEYLSVMEEEANRLSQMTSNILYLSKIQKQGILTDKTQFNLSEQLRSSVLLLEKKWSKKEVEFLLDFDEYYIVANEDMLKEVWVNILDNAIKFADEKSEISVNISKENEKQIIVTIENRGPEIPKKDYEAVFNKFYQCEKSRSTEGNGIGLSIVKHIVELHGGSVFAKSENRKTAFTVVLPV